MKGGRLINATVRFSLGPVMIATATVVALGGFYPCSNCLLSPGGKTCEATDLPHPDTQTLEARI